MSADIHTCSYRCQRPACVLAQRDELAKRAEQDAAEIVRLRGEVKKLADDVQVPPDPTAHRWNDDGERCLICGDKDWMGGPCSGGAVSATVNGVNGLVVKWRESAASAKRYSVTEYEDGCASAEKRCADELESAIRSSEHLATAGVRTASIAPAEAKGDALLAAIAASAASVGDYQPYDQVVSMFAVESAIRGAELDTHQPAGGGAVAWIAGPVDAQRIGITDKERAALIAGGVDVSHYRPLVYGDTQPPAAQVQHPDDVAVDRFAAAMKAKLADARAKGRGGWDDDEDLEQHLSNLLRDHVEKGDPRDVANFCCFLWNRGEGIAKAAQVQQEAGDAEWYTSEQESHCIDFDGDPANQLSILLKNDGTVSYAYLRGDERGTGHGLAMLKDAVKRWAGNTPSLRAGEAVALTAWVGTMQASNGTNYYVCVGFPGGKYITPQVYDIRGRADYDVAEWKHMLGQGPKPDILAFDTEGTTPPAAQVQGEAPTLTDCSVALDEAVKVICECTGETYGFITDDYRFDHLYDAAGRILAIANKLRPEQVAHPSACELGAVR